MSRITILPGGFSSPSETEEERRSKQSEVASKALEHVLRQDELGEQSAEFAEKLADYVEGYRTASALQQMERTGGRFIIATDSPTPQLVRALVCECEHHLGDHVKPGEKPGKRPRPCQRCGCKDFFEKRRTAKSINNGEK